MSHPSRAHASRITAIASLPAAALALLLPATALGAAAPPSPAAAQDAPPITVGSHAFARRTLANGLKAVAVKDEEPSVTVFMVIGAGNRQESPSTTGLAHLTEHAMYAGTAKLGPDGHDKRIHEIGGESNAFTREDYTLFYDHHVPVERLDEVLAMEADRLRGLAFDEKAVLHERDRLDDEEARTFTPAMARDELVEAAVYRAHPYGAGLLDAKGHTLGPRLSITQVRAFYDAYYQPDDTCVVVAGAVEPARALAAIESAFGALLRGPARPPLPSEPEVARSGRAVFASELSQDRLEQVWLVPALGDPDRPTLDVLARVLSRRTLSDGNPVRATMGDRVDQELFRVAASGPKAAAELDGLLAGVRETPLPAADVEQTKGLLADDFTSLPLRGRPYFSLAGLFGVLEVLGHPEAPGDRERAIKAVTPESIRDVARRRLAPERRFDVVFLGSGVAPAPLPDDPPALARAAQDAESSGDLDRAAAAYTRLLEKKPNAMNTVISLASRGQVRMEQADYASAIADFEQALEVVDYPAVRDLLDEAQRLQAGGERTRDAAKPAAPTSEAPKPAAK